MVLVRFYCIYWRYRCTVIHVVVVCTVRLVKLFLIAVLASLFFRRVAHSNDSGGCC